MVTEPEHAHIMSSYLNGFSVAKKRPPLSLGIEPATFRYNGQHANHYTAIAPLCNTYYS